MFFVGVAAALPHIVYVLVDDWGWSDVGYHNKQLNTSTGISTPNIDALVAGGIELDRLYAYQFCSPSRSSIQSGRLPVHVNDVNAAYIVRNPDDPMGGFAGIPRNMTGLAQKLASAGYAAHFVGKWDAGAATPTHTPVGRGYATSMHYYSHANDYYTYADDACPNATGGGTIPIADLWDTNQPAWAAAVGNRYEEVIFAERAADVIRAHPAGQPLFLFYAFHLVHAPLEVPQPYIDRYSWITDSQWRRNYTAMVAYLDDAVGNLTAELRAAGLWENTLLVLTADNGGPSYAGGGANNYPLKGGKMSDWEGGVRVNGLVAGGAVPPAARGTRKTQGLAHVADWYTTFCHLAGVDPFDPVAAAANLPPVDGVNLWEWLIDPADVESPRSFVQLSTHALIAGRLKLITGVLGLAGWTGPVFPNGTAPAGGIPGMEDCDAAPGCLFNVFDDPTEHHNLAATMPDVVFQLRMQLAQLNQTAYHPNRGTPDPARCPVFLGRYRGFSGPWVE